MTTAEYISKFREKNGRLPSQVELTRNLKLSPQQAIRAIQTMAKRARTEPNAVHTPEDTRKMHERDLYRGAISIGLYLVALLTSGLSIYFTALWFTQMFSTLIAGAISVSMVIYMVLSPQAVQYVHGIVKLPLWASFTIALIFSMGSTVAGQYNKLTENIDIVSVNERALLDSLKAEEAELLAAIEVDRDQQAFHQRTLESLSSTAEDRMANYAFISTERNMVNMLSGEIEAKQARLVQIREDVREELGKGSVGATEERKDFYSWLATVLGAQRNLLEFWIAALPAVFIDIIAALSLNIALGMRRENEG